MRIIAGEFRSRKLYSPEGLGTRPMPDRVRESVFGMLGTRVKGAEVVDLFAGTGSIGLEALSRGASSCLFVERDKFPAGALRRNIETLRCEERATVVVGDALGMATAARAPRPTDLVFMDPPFPLVLDPLGWERVKAQCALLIGLLAEDGFLILRTPSPFLHEAPPEGGEGVEAPGEPAGGEPAAAPPAAKPRPDRRNKYQRDRRRWQDEPDAESKQAMRRGGPLVPKRAAQPRGAPAPVELEADDDSEIAGEEAESLTAVSVTGAEPGPPARPKIPVDLTIAGAKGPETHLYGKSAVHWYMRATQE